MSPVKHSILGSKSFFVLPNGALLGRRVSDVPSKGVFDFIFPVLHVSVIGQAKGTGIERQTTCLK